MVCCARCTCIRKHTGRGLCSSCYDHVSHRGELDLYPRIGRRRDAVAEDYEELRQTYGDAFQAIAARLKMAPGTLERTLYRAGFKATTSSGVPNGGRKVFVRED